MAVSKVIYGGNTLIDLTPDTIKADKLLKGYTAHGADGEPITGTMEGGIDTSDATAVASEILSGKTAYAKGAKVTGTMPTQTLPTPSISVSSGGLITATDALSASGYVASGTKSATKQLTTQAAKTITPSTSSQTAVASGRYTTGAVTVSAVPTQTKSATPSASAQTIKPDSGKFLSQVTVNGDSNLVADNIKSGVSIFGVAGSYEGSGGGSGGESNSFETATVYLAGLSNASFAIFENNQIIARSGTFDTMENVIVGSLFCVRGDYSEGFVIDGGTFIEYSNNYSIISVDDTQVSIDIADPF